MNNISHYIDFFLEQNGSDLYITVGTNVHIRNVEDRLVKVDENILTEENVRSLLAELLSETAIDEFDSTLEFNSAMDWQGRARLRLNVFRQRQNTGIVIRRIRPEMPSAEDLGLPKIYTDLAMEKRGLVLIVGPTGSGKTTSMASMIDHRNSNSSGHIVTIEDPIEYVHTHKNCIITQRDVGIDTYSFGIALKNVLRQRPDVVVIGEIRDRENMEHALVFSETGHLCIATIHAGNSIQALERVINFFPEEKHRQVMLSLSLNLKGLLCQRLIRNKIGKRSLALEIMLNQGVIKNLIREGRLKEIPEHIEKGRDQGMLNFDQSLFELIKNNEIEEDIGLAESDNPSNLKLRLTQHAMSTKPHSGITIPLAAKPQF